MFEYESGWESSAVIALDDLSITHGSCFPPPIDPTVNPKDNNGKCTFSNTLEAMLGITTLSFLLHFECCENRGWTICGNLVRILTHILIKSVLKQRGL